ncbi:nucleotidyltransferase family protein [Metallosphaera tengchongensis]|uniref:nucleotidyltransferase family protein n=1 Tax=Metallosphaera tengchongensis TaxID=1532350 RepID=UPI001FEB266A|nr:nucleotidyltransferase family protein [Metallosphaera tengchongensis]
MEMRFKEAFRKAVRLIDRFYPDYALIGRFARNFYAMPETTLDIDFLVDLDDHQVLAEIIDRSLEYEISPKDVGHWQYKLLIKGVRVDLVKPPGFKIDKEVISRRRLMSLEGIGKVYVLSPEDLAVLYAVSSTNRGVRDALKAKDIIIYSKRRYDFNVDYFLRKCEENSLKAVCLALL